MSTETPPALSPIQATNDSRGKLVGISEHAQRFKLHGELHMGAAEMLDAPIQISHLTLLCDNDQAPRERVLLGQLCERYGVTPPTMQSNHFSALLGIYRIRWERHTEYSTYTFFHHAPFETPFADPAIGHVPSDWLASLPGEVIAATHIAIEEKTRPQRSLKELSALFASNTVMGAEVAAGGAIAWTDNQIHSDGFARILIRDVELRSRQAGRLVLRLLDIETYRMLAMIPVPLMRSYIPKLVHFDERLAALCTNNVHVEDEQRLLDELTKLASEIESILAVTSHRHNSSSIYYDIVKLRISELRENRIQGLQMFQEFMEQRLTPAMGTCNLVNNKLETLSTRVVSASSLLRTRVEISMEKQSRDLLKSMDKRADLQLRLQETVESLSIVVLSYYLLSLAAYGFKALKAAGLHINPDIATGIAMPVVVGVVYVSVKRLRERLLKHSAH